MKITPMFVFGFLVIATMTFLLLVSTDMLLSLKNILERTCPAGGLIPLDTCESKLLMTKSLIISLVVGVPGFIIYISRLMYKIYKKVGVYE